MKYCSSFNEIPDVRDVGMRTQEDYRFHIDTGVLRGVKGPVVCALFV